MKKSITTLSVVVLLLFQTYKEHRTPCRQTSDNFHSGSVFEGKISPVLLTAFRADGGGDPPWKDPWQWIQIFRKLWEF